MKNNFKFLTFLFLMLAGFSACNTYEDDVLPSRNSGETVLNNDTFSTYKNQPVQIAVLANDTITADGVLTFGKVTYGTVVSDSGRFVYQPAPGFTGSDRFFYKYCSGAACDSALVTVNILEPNTNCVLKANRDQVTFSHQNPVTIPMLVNDNTCGPVTVKMLTHPKNGTAVLLQNQELRYTPNPNFYGADSLMYEVQTPDGRRASATVSVRKVSNCQLAANADVVQTLANDSVIIFPVLNDNTCNNPVLINISSLPQHGTVRVLPNNRFSYEPVPNFTGSDSFMYQLCAGGNCVSSTITVNVTARPVNCVTSFAARNDSLGFASSIPGSSYNLNVLLNDIYCPNSQATLSIIQSPANGTATIINVGGVPYINYVKNNPSGGAYTDNLRYQLCMVVNGQTVCRNASVTVIFW